jgi:hypothetical protein
MPFEWLAKLHAAVAKTEGYAEKTLAPYRLGMRAGGSIVGVVVRTEADCCDSARALPDGAVYLPDEAPALPLADCPHRHRCRCTYRPKMAYQDGPR